MKVKNRFNTELFYLNILIVLLFIVMIAVGYQTLNSQKEKIRIEVENTANEFKTRIQAGVASVLYLQAAAGEIYKNREIPLAYATKVHEINPQGDFVLDDPALSNLTGFGGMVQTKAVIHEMASSLALTKYFAIIHGLNKSFVRVYYASKHRFSTRYPYVWSDQFMWNRAMQQEPLWVSATPSANPEGTLFFTPLHKCERKEKILVTIGQPIYHKKEFLGTVNLDIEVAAESAFLGSKNVHDGSYVIVNKEGEIVAASGLEGYSDKMVNRALTLVPSEILANKDTGDELLSLGSKYLYVKTFKSAPWKLYYIKEKAGIYMNSLYYVGMLLVVILLLFRVKTLIKRLADSRDELERQALTDPMTKLFNRRYLAETTRHLLELMRRNRSPLSTVMLDIDKFKKVNDTYGHQVGDDVIILLAETLQKHTRKSDVICRLGGEEFIVLLPDTTVDGALSMAETLRKEVEKLVITLSDAIELRFTISIGVSAVHMDDQNFDPAMTRSDAALYEAKESGRNRVCRAKED